MKTRCAPVATMILKAMAKVGYGLKVHRIHLVVIIYRCCKNTEENAKRYQGKKKHHQLIRWGFKQLRKPVAVDLGVYPPPARRQSTMVKNSMKFSGKAPSTAVQTYTEKTLSTPANWFQRGVMCLFFKK
jgi:hypothetical protein